MFTGSCLSLPMFPIPVVLSTARVRRSRNERQSKDPENVPSPYSVREFSENICQTIIVYRGNDPVSNSLPDALYYIAHPGVAILLQTKEKSNSTGRSPNGRPSFLPRFAFESRCILAPLPMLIIGCFLAECKRIGLRILS